MGTLSAGRAAQVCYAGSRQKNTRLTTHNPSRHLCSNLGQNYEGWSCRNSSEDIRVALLLDKTNVVREIADLIAISDHDQFDPDERLTNLADLLQICGTLVTMFRETDNNEAGVSIDGPGQLTRCTKDFHNVEENVSETDALGELRFAHFSVKEYLTSGEIAYKQFAITEPTMHVILADYCLYRRAVVTLKYPAVEYCVREWS